ncbi:hypothetical protein Ahy_B05g078866 [Arachis hypogaea]|uniref:Uncharacterized protein n=1 Tax=Arachis hypogaea TaxID=3818 RepID=A0A444Z8C6_ARAHY|nr:hypothetical protein Ahy_B05g078866 [Arachis hypogaea]
MSRREYALVRKKQETMAAKPLTTEAIALTEKKMDMTLDDIIKMSKNKKTRKQRRVPVKHGPT